MSEKDFKKDLQKYWQHILVVVYLKYSKRDTSQKEKWKMNNKKVLSLNWNEHKELLEVHENEDVYYLVVDNRTGKEVKFDYYENESAIDEFWKA